MPRIYTFLTDNNNNEVMLPIGWILHLAGRWYLQWRLGRLSIERREKGK